MSSTSANVRFRRTAGKDIPFTRAIADQDPSGKACRMSPTIDVLSLLPHRYPFLLIDRITEVEPGKRASGMKRVTGGEWSCVAAGVLDASCAMPHTLIVEALAQLTAAILIGLVDGANGAVGYFLGIDHVRFRGEAMPGDELRLEVELRQFRRGICRTRGTARVDGRVIVSADLTTVVRAQ